MKKQEARSAHGSCMKLAADCSDTLKQKEEEKGRRGRLGQCIAPPKEPCALRTARKMQVMSYFRQ